MRVLLLSHSEITRNPRARALAVTLVAAGHDVIAVCGGAGSAALPGVEIRRVPTRVPIRWGRLGWLLRRIQPAQVRRAIFRRSIKRAAAAVGADLTYPMSKQDLEIAKKIASSSQAIFREPHWPTAGDNDIIDRAPNDARFSTSPAGAGAPFYTAADRRAGRPTEPSRHRDRKIAIVSRRTTTTPAQYLEAAAARAGMDVSQHDGELDWSEVDPQTLAVVIVESPYPPIAVTGSNENDIPVLYWVHHGEHHLPANLRLLRRYGAHAVLLAHSWHLAHRFPVPVHRFPFAVASELLPAHKPLADRTRDIAKVGAGVAGGGGRYARRQRLVDALRRQYPHSSSFEYGIAPHEMAELYGDARVVLNEGGDRHHPVTMRVFEAIGVGAFLLTDDAPGLDLLFHADHYALIADDVGSQVNGLLADPTTAEKAAAAHQHAHQHHLYDHRLDDLLEIAERTEVFATEYRPASHPVAKAICDDPDVQEVALFGIDDITEELESHVLWDGPMLLATTHDRTVDAVVLGPHYRDRIDIAAERAQRFVYAAAIHHETVERFAQSRWPDASLSVNAGILRVDLGASSYRMRPTGHPLAGA